MAFIESLEDDFIREFRTVPETTESVFDLINFLEASQYDLIQLMAHNNIWQGAIPSDPGGEGAMEFGLVPYWIKNPPKFILEYIDKNKILKGVWEVLTFLVPNKISGADYTALKTAATGQGVVADDGTIFGESVYEQMDPGWMWAFVNYLIVKYAHDRAEFSKKPVTPIQLNGAGGGEVKIAVVGDWGTGVFPTGAAQEVMDQILGMKPDYIIHLGDVYYAGTGGDFLPFHEEQNNYLNVWPTAEQQAAGTSFMLNSNHEMYSGAKGYFFALTDPRFIAQQETSYFALQYGGWTLLGLDSAYYTTATFFMLGSIGGTVDTTQNDWIKGLNISPDKTIVMTHHTGLTTSGAAENSQLCDEINTALNGDPAAWYWGHIHNGIVYNSPTVTGRKTLSRCVGHGAVPFGDGWGVPGPFVSYYAHTPNPSLPNSIRVLNGFAMLTITSEGQVTEEFFEQGNGSPVFCNKY